MKKVNLSIIACLGFLLWSVFLCAESIEKSIPELLKPWIPWVLHEEEDFLCPTRYNEPRKFSCFWPSRLVLEVQTRGATFEQYWSIGRLGWVVLPGNDEFWPVEARVDGKNAVVILKNGVPSVFLMPGNYKVTGSFQWDSMPESLVIPPETALIQLSVNGTKVSFSNLDEDGRLWLQKGASEGEEDEDDNLEIKVHRLLVDEVPFQLHTRLELDVSGRPRSMELGPVLLDRFIPMSLESGLPVSLKPNGILKVQVRPGRWGINFLARHKGPVDQLTIPKPTAFWAEDEIWAFSAKNQLRMVTLEGVQNIDPLQTSLPSEWHRYPAFPMAAGSTVKLVEKRRGDSDSEWDKLHLRRYLWLDFDGKGYTIQDQIRGTVKRAWRLEMNEPLSLERVSVGGRDQLITRRSEQSATGFEIREGTLKVEADSRMAKRRLRVAVGWGNDFESMSAWLHYGPGWRVLAATGVDEAHGTWMSFWDLWNIFLLVLLILMVAKLRGVPWASCAGVVLFFTFPEPNAPQWIWLLCLVLVVLVSVVPEGKVKTSLAWLRNIGFLVLVGWALFFVQDQVRKGVFPVLENPHRGISGDFRVEDTWQRPTEESQTASDKPPADYGVAQVAAEDSLEETEELAGEEDEEGESGGDEEGESDVVVQEEPKKHVLFKKADLGAMPKRAAPLSPLSSSKMVSVLKNVNLGQQVAQFDPNANVQVGQGLPRWKWETIHLIWSGPVTASEGFRLWLLPPWLNFFLSLFRAATVIFLVLFLLKETFGMKALDSFRKTRIPVDRIAGILAFLFSLSVVSARAESIPSDELLEQLKSRLQEDAKCFPVCASTSRMQIEYSTQELVIRMEVDAGIRLSVPLPGNAKHWIPSSVTVDGESAEGIVRDKQGALWLSLAPGSHQVLLRGPLAERDSVQIPLYIKSHNVSAKGSGWIVEGIHKNGQSEQNLELRKSGVQASRSEGQLDTATLPSFVLVERELALGLFWKVRTRVSRQTPTGSAIVLSVPLIVGESVTTPSVRVVKGNVAVNMGSRSSEFFWDSVLEQKSPIKLKAPEQTSWTELWRLDASAIWTVELKGIPIIHHHNEAGLKMPMWRPWPGEEIEISVVRPLAVEGQTLNVEKSVFDIRPGKRVTEAALTFELKSSRGAEHVVQIPPDGKLESVVINGSSQPIQSEQGKVVLPVSPGSQNVELKWQEPRGISAFFQSSRIDLGINSVNSSIILSMPSSRWLLLVGGPRVGPQILIWGELFVILLMAVVLGRLGTTPLTTLQWILLGLGLSQCGLEDNCIIVGFILVLAWRQKFGVSLTRWRFNGVQILLVLGSLAFLTSIFLILDKGFFGNPEVHVAGNLSNTGELKWFLDRTSGLLPSPWVFSMPVLWYRLAMLLWALWFAFSLIRWSRWGWGCFIAGGFWKKKGLISPHSSC